MITSSDQYMLLQPTFDSSIPLQSDLQANETKAFVLHKVELNIKRLLFKDAAEYFTTAKTLIIMFSRLPVNALIKKQV